MLEIMEATLRLSTPLLFAAMGGLLCEKSGIATICLEGCLLIGAWVAAVVVFYTHNPWQALLPCAIAGALLFGIHAFLVTQAKADAIISGLIINLLVSGIIPVMTKFMFGTPTNTPGIPLPERFHEWNVPSLSQLPILGFFFRQMPLTYLAFFLVGLLQLILTRSTWGLRLRACGDDPETLLSCGVSPFKVRVWALSCGGAICAWGGAYLSISHASQFTRDMASGRGYIALTAVIFGNWKPLPAMAACLLFGLADAIQIRLQTTSMVPLQFVQAMPYVVTLLILIGFVGKSRPPAAIGG